MSTNSLSLSEQNKRLREKLKITSRELEAAKALIERVCQTVGFDHLSGVWDKNKYQRGWIWHWISPLREILEKNLNNTISGTLRNEIIQSVEAIIMQLAINGKYGIRLPHNPRPGDIEIWEQKHNSQLMKQYPPCVICGEDRITHQCHIIPAAHGGKYHKDNLLDMCPLHHHLFDNGRLTKEEWGKLELSAESKMEAAVQYMKEVQLPIQKYFWHEIPDAVYPDLEKNKRKTRFVVNK